MAVVGPVPPGGEMAPYAVSSQQNGHKNCMIGYWMPACRYDSMFIFN
jgi:hypothetical protein